MKKKIKLQVLQKNLFNLLNIRRKRNHRMTNFREREFQKKKMNFFVNFQRSSDIQQLQFLIQRDLRKFLQHNYWICIEIRLKSLTGPVS